MRGFAPATGRRLACCVRAQMSVAKRLLALLGIAFASTSTPASSETRSPEQAVVVHFMYGSTDLTRLREVESRLEKAIAAAKVGEYDGDEIAVSGKDGFLYMYGPDADRLFDVVKPILQSTPFMRGAKVKKRYGPAKDGIKEVVVVIEP